MRRAQPRYGTAMLWCAVLGCAADDGGGDEDETGSAASTSTGSTTPTGDTGAEGSTGAMVDAAAVLDRASRYATDLVQINATPFASQHGLAAAVNVFVDPAQADLFRTLDPGTAVPVTFPEGTLVVKEHLDAQGAYAGYLLMYKAYAGYDPDGSDWWWARVDPTDTVQETGSVGFCIDCHAAAPWGHVFGVAADNRAP